jgi:hypothetical protein
MSDPMSAFASSFSLSIIIYSFHHCHRIACHKDIVDDFIAITPLRSEI